MVNRSDNETTAPYRGPEVARVRAANTGLADRARRCLAFWHEKPILTLMVCLAGTIAAVLWHQARTHDKAVRSTILQEAAGQLVMLEEFRSLYTSEVVSRVSGHGIEVTHDYAENEGAIPLPATLSMLLGERISAMSGGGSMRLYSPYPFPWREGTGGVLDDFERAAWDEIVKNPDRPFFRFEETVNGPILRYASADRMRQSCIGCHNNHPETPRRGWMVGDVRGVLEVSVPVPRGGSTSLVNSLPLLILLGVLGLASIWSVTVKLRRESALLEGRVKERTAELKSENKKRREAEEEREGARRLESIGRLAAGLAHEINTPTQYVGDNTYFLKESFHELIPVLRKAEELADAVYSGTESSEFADEVKVALGEADVDYLVKEIPSTFEQSLYGIDCVRKIVQSMKEFSHPHSEGMTKIDLNRSIEVTIVVTTSEWTQVAEVETDFDLDLPLVSCLPGEINQVFLNLIVNAAHAIADVVGDGRGGKGTITISTRRDGDFVELSIVDTGSGIPEEARGRIFEPFFTTKEVGKGSGQGLTIAHSVVVNKHGGTLDFTTEIGKGSTFIIRLPLISQGAEEGVD